MIKKILIAISITALAACTPSYTDETGKYTVLPEELKDCKIYEIYNGNGNRMNVMRCPNSTTTTKVPSGKTSRTAVVID